ncbi:hypothetical protein [Aliiruegeria lutimaris]|uniref:Uncharacterized protein n=1 Tax=Aliiruegeria lutimaris TaxID=571298 RepID=A0A1G9AW27_9RHOB|nr:hypothetical protein [Aliiruegeria lutimaris]SDK31516.1 hypothetical protein SAMN04488026_103724 [Aliiruegeria lutimaris]
MTWAEVWADMTVYKFAYECLSPVNHNGSHSYANSYFNEVLRDIGSKYETTRLGNEKNAYTSAICSAAKEEGILVFTIGMDTDDSVADETLEDCATLSSYYYDVQSVDIASAFASIALQINQLRLTQYRSRPDRPVVTVHEPATNRAFDPLLPQFSHTGAVEFRQGLPSRSTRASAAGRRTGNAIWDEI